MYLENLVKRIVESGARWVLCDHDGAPGTLEAITDAGLQTTVINFGPHVNGCIPAEEFVQDDGTGTYSSNAKVKVLDKFDRACLASLRAVNCVSAPPVRFASQSITPYTNDIQLPKYSCQCSLFFKTVSKVRLDFDLNLLDLGAFFTRNVSVLFLR
jgi:hypothetical protein